MTSSGEVSAAGSPSGTPTANQVPKYGTLIPNRIFVGGIAANTNEQELKQYFASHGAVKDCKIIADRAGVSKGYGFVTFESQEDAEKIIKNESDSLVFKDRKLNIGPAIRKQQAFPGTRIYEPSLSPGSTILYTNGVPYTFQNGMAVFHPPEGYPVPAQPQPAYPVMMAPYLTQPSSTYAYQQSPTVGGTASQWRCWTPQSPIGAVPAGATSQYVYTPVIHPGEMMYQPAQYQPTDLTDASMIEAAAPPAEGSITREVSTPVQHHYAEQQVTPDQRLLRQQQAGTPVVSKKTMPYTTMQYHPAVGSLFATPPTTPSPLATPVKIYAPPQHLLTTAPVMTHDQMEHHDDGTVGTPMTPPVTPHTKLGC